LFLITTAIRAAMYLLYIPFSVFPWRKLSVGQERDAAQLSANCQSGSCQSNSKLIYITFPVWNVYFVLSEFIFKISFVWLSTSNPRKFIFCVIFYLY
jgi:hypothetical protein